MTEQDRNVLLNDLRQQESQRESRSSGSGSVV